MKSLLIYANDTTKWVELPEKHRHSYYAEAVHTPMLTTRPYDDFPVKGREITFQWRGTIIRRDGRVVFDFFEEI